MSVATELGLEPDGEAMVQACHAWGEWSVLYPPLRVADGLLEVRAWARGADPGDVDALLRALARQGSPTGGNDAAAAVALSWILLPGAQVLARSLCRLDPRVDQLVAAQLWLEVREFPWNRLEKVAANVLANTRRHVLRDLTTCSRRGSQGPRDVVLPMDDPFWGSMQVSAPAPEESQEELLRNIREGTVAAGVLTNDDWGLLLELATTSAHERTRNSGSGGLTSLAVLTAVAAGRGVSASSIQRRARASITAARSHVQACW